MIALPMIYVIPIGGSVEKGRICLICRAQSNPGVVAFVRPEQGPDQFNDFAEAMSSLAKAYKDLISSVVFQKEARIVERFSGAPIEVFDDDVQTFGRSVARKSGVMIAGLPFGGLSDSIPVNPQSQSTVIFYRNRQFSETFVNLNFSSPHGPIASDAYRLLDEAARRLIATTD